MLEQAVLNTVTVNGAVFHYVSQGQGEPVIFVHGSLGDYRAWGPQFEPFAQQFQAVSCSRRYHFPNLWVGEGTDYTVSLHADDLIELIQALGFPRVSLVGNSFGAYTSLVATSRRPDLIRRLVIGEPPILPWLKDIPGGQAYFDAFMRGTWEPAKHAFQSGDLEQGVGLFIDGVSNKEGAFASLPDHVRRRMMDNARSLEAETASPGYFDTPLAPQQAAQITLPVLLLRGEHSPKMFHLIMDCLAQSLPNARSVTVPNASHSIPSNNPPVYNQVALEFLNT